MAGLSTQLIVPIALWGNEPPTHCISCIYITPDHRTLVTGCNDGQICLWDIEQENGVWSDKSMIPRCMLFGHSSAILCLTTGKGNDASILVSSSESGEMSTWDLSDGRCMEGVRLQYVHTHIQPHQVIGHESTALFCNGFYAEILVINIQTLETLFTLTSRLNPDWISAMHVIRSPKRNEDVIVGLSISGVIKMWTLSGNETRSSEPIFEHESRQIRSLNALDMICCQFNPRTVLVVCSKCWQIFDAGDFSLLCSVQPKLGERWTGGEFLSIDRVIIWSDCGRGMVYQLPVK